MWEEEDCVTEFRPRGEIHPGRFAIKDYDFEAPSARLLAESFSRDKQRGAQELEVFDYPGGFRRRSDGSRLADLRLQSDEAANAVSAGSGWCRTFESGRTFELVDHPRRNLNTHYVLTSVQHSARSPEIYSSEGENNSYRNSFTVIPKTIPFRPPASARRPILQGCQTGVVTGADGEEIHTDKYGRVKVHFHWDRHSPCDAGSSCWVRVTQAWAGKNFGSIWIPRVGQEVIVDFLDGDPDRPIITGAVYNADQVHPADLPANKMRSGFHSQSTETGSPSHYNQVRIDDTRGKEEILVHAQKDWSSKVNNNRTTKTGNYDVSMIVGSQQIHIASSDTERIGKLDVDIVSGDQKTGIKGSSVITIGAAELEAILGNAEHSTRGQENHTSGMIYSSSSRSQQSWEAGGSTSLFAGELVYIKSKATATLGAANITLKAGIIRLKGNVTCNSLLGGIIIISPKYTPGVNNNV
jgi:type VI secretion system secreted protein VgrG